MRDREEFRVLTGQTRSANYSVYESLADRDGLIRIHAKCTPDIGNLFFTVPEKILSREQRELECTPRIRDCNNHDAIYNFRLTKGEGSY